jgi:hypothetical protein
MNNISEIQIGLSYNIPDYEWMLRDFVNPDNWKEHEWKFKGKDDILPSGTPFVPLEIRKVHLEDDLCGNTQLYFVKILTAKNQVVRWLPLLDKDLSFIRPVTNCE